MEIAPKASCGIILLFETDLYIKKVVASFIGKRADPLKKFRNWVLQFLHAKTLQYYTNHIHPMRYLVCSKADFR